MPANSEKLMKPSPKMNEIGKWLLFFMADSFINNFTSRRKSYKYWLDPQMTEAKPLKKIAFCMQLTKNFFYKNTSWYRTSKFTYLS